MSTTDRERTTPSSTRRLPRVLRWLRRSSPQDEGHVCPCWFVYTFDNPLRRLLYRPETLLRPYVDDGMTVLDIGCGGGINTLALARLVGETGKVLAVDVQQAMLDMVGRRLKRVGLESRVQLQRCHTDDIGLDDPVDFVNAFWMVHEVPDTRAFLAQLHRILRPGGRLLITEPVFHVSRRMFSATLEEAARAGLHHDHSPRIRFSMTALLHKPG